MTNDLVADFLTRLRNADRAGKEVFVALSSRLVKGVIDVLVREGYVERYEEREIRPHIFVLDVYIKRYNGASVIQEIRRVSKLGRRVYRAVSNLPRVQNGLGIAILSTAKGVISDREAYQKHVGGEVLCYVY